MRKLCLFALISVCISIVYAHGGGTYRFFNVGDGLSSTRINTIKQDYEGYIWIGTEDGLNRFNGKDFVSYRNIPNDSTSLLNNSVKQIFEDSGKRLWITTTSGICLYDRKKDRFNRFDLPVRETGWSSNLIQYVTEDRDKNLWFSIFGRGVSRLDMESNEVKRFDVDNSALCSNFINCIFEDSQGTIWLGSEHGLCSYDPVSGEISTHYMDAERKISFSKVSSISEGKNKDVWIATLVNGVYIYSIKDGSFTKFKKIKEDKKEVCSLMKDRNDNMWISLFDRGVEIYSLETLETVEHRINVPPVNIFEGTIHSLFEDRQGNIWLGIYQKGLLFLSTERQMFRNYEFNPFHDGTIRDGAIVPVCCDSRGEIWLGKDGGGFFRLDKDKNVIASFYMEGSDRKNIIVSMFEDSATNIWIGTYLDGAMRFSRSEGTVDLRIPMGKGRLLSPHVSDFMETPDKRIWMATNGGGINIYDPRTGRFEYIVRKEDGLDNQLVDNWCNVLYLDSGRVWIGTYNGLCTYDIARKRFVDYYTDRLPDRIVRSLYKDRSGNMWVGTQNGLARIDAKTDSVESYGILEGLGNSLIFDIKPDHLGNLWMTTGGGITKLNMKTLKFHNYTTNDGLATNECNQQSFDMTPSGEFVFGTTEGFTTFYPTEEKDHALSLLNLTFDDLFIYDKKMEIGDEKGSVLSARLDETEKLVLEHDQNYFSVTFSAMEYLLPEDVEYKVCLEGFDEHWLDVKDKVTYTNLSPGNYILKVKARRDGSASFLERELPIYIKAPVWFTVYAKCFYGLAFILLCWAVYLRYKEEARKKKEESLLQEKLQLFTDISHEIRTPLTLIISPLTRLMTTTKDAHLQAVYGTMFKHANRLLLLVNQIMDIRSLEFNKKKLSVDKVDITKFVSDLKEGFDASAEEKGLSLGMESVPDRIEGYIDTDIVSKIMYNLISNAIKYTEKGFVRIRLGLLEDERLSLEIADSGIGISKEMKDKIFERFFMVNYNNVDRTLSSGIGLHLTSKIVKLHKGSISLESEPGKGTSFKVVLPIARRFYMEEELVSKSEATIPITSMIDSFASVAPAEENTPSASGECILLIEDNKDIRQLVKSELSGYFRIIEAGDGKEGLFKALERKPDLIISDIIMPELDGLELCKKIRNNEQLKLVPIILLSAKNSVAQQVEGIRAGADAYVTKPFDFNYLKALIVRLLQKSRHLSNLGLNMASINEVKKSEVTSDDLLREKIIKVIDENLMNPDFSVDQLAFELSLSRTHLNRKFKSILSESPAVYIKRARLRKAAELLLTEPYLSVSEIAFKMGFSSPSYFTQSFREFYGVTPKEYVACN